MDSPERFEPYERTQDYVEALLHGRRPEPWSDVTTEDAEVLRMAGVLNAVGAAPRPRGQFVADLAAELEQISGSRSRRFWRFSRRTLLRGMAGAAGLFVAGAAADRAAGVLSQPHPGAGWVAVARAAEVAPGDAKRFLANGVEGYLVNLGGTLSAVSALCTHLPCVVAWRGSDQQFICPCHQAEFTASGEWRPNPSYDRPLSPLPTFAVKQAGGLLYVNAGQQSAEAMDDDDDYPRP